MENNDFKKAMEDIFSVDKEYYILKKEDVLLLKELIDNLMETYSYPHIRKKLHNRDDIVELLSEFSSSRILGMLDKTEDAGINFPYLSFELNERGISVSEATLARPSTIGGIVKVIESKMKESELPRS